MNENSLSSSGIIPLISMTVITGFVLILPIFFLPITSDFYEFNKLALLVAGASLLTVLWIIQSVVTKKISFRQYPMNLPVFIFMLAVIASLIFVSANKMEAILSPLGAGPLLVAAWWYFVVSQLLTADGKRLVGFALIGSGVILAFVTIMQAVGIFHVLSAPNFLQDKNFSPTGSFLTTFLYLFPILIYSAFQAARWRKNNFALGLLLTSTIIMGIGLVLSVITLFSNSKPILLPFMTGWSIAIDTLKINPLLGVGAENFLVTFSQLRPVGMNLSQFWNVRYSTSSTVFFHIFTTIGLLGVIGFGLILFTAIRNLFLERNEQFFPGLVAVIMLGLFFLVPGNSLLLFIVFLLLGLATHSTDKLHFRFQEQRLSILVIGLLAVVIGIVAFQTTKVYAAEVAFKRAVDLLNANKAQEAYTSLNQAMQANPYHLQYRLTAAQINLLLAQAITRNKDLTDQQKQAISQLVNAAITQGKNGVALARRSPVAWENLADMYRALLRTVKGADQWAVTSYVEAIRRDPTNPVLRLNLGGVFYALNNLENAIKQYEVATELKPDYANAHYNLALALKQGKNYRRALAETEATMKLLKADSEDYKKAQAEQEILKKLVAENTPPPTAAQPPAGETLTEPPTPQPDAKKPVELPETAAPPTPEPDASPIGSPRPSTVPSATPTGNQSPTPRPSTNPTTSPKP